MVLFPNSSVDIFRELPNGSEIGTDTEGNPILLSCGTDGYDDINHCLSKINTVVGDLQPNSSIETMNQYGSTVQSSFVLYLDLGVDIKNDDKVMVSGYDGYFQVTGDPKRFLSVIPHLEVILTKERIS